MTRFIGKTLCKPKYTGRMFLIKEGTPADKIGEGTDPQTEQAIQKYLTAKGLVIRTAEQESKYVESITQQKIDEATGKWATNLEKDVKELTGVDRQANEKYYDYFKRATSERLKEIDTLKGKITEFEKKGGAAAEAQLAELRQQLKAAQEQYAVEIKKRDDELTGYKTTMFNTTVETAWEKALAKIVPSFVQPTDEIMKKALEDAIYARRVKFFNDHKAIDNNGVLGFTDKDGKPLLSKVDGKHKSMDDIVSEIFTDLVDKKRAQGGSGSGGGGNPPAGGGDGGAGGGADWKTASLPMDRIKSKMDLHDYLQKDLKMSPATKEFSEAFNTLAAQHKLPLRAR